MPKLVRLNIRDAVVGLSAAALVGCGLALSGPVAGAAMVGIALVISAVVFGAVFANRPAVRASQSRTALIPIRIETPPHRR